MAVKGCVGLWGQFFFLILEKMAFIAGSVMTFISALLLVGSLVVSFEVIVSVCDWGIPVLTLWFFLGGSKFWLQEALILKTIILDDNCSSVLGLTLTILSEDPVESAGKTL